jgi:hypothetical protein
MSGQSASQVRRDHRPRHAFDARLCLFSHSRRVSPLAASRGLRTPAYSAIITVLVSV